MKPILVVEDEPDLAEIWRELLEESGYRVKTAHSGSQALTLLSRDRFALLVTDLHLPDMSGWDVMAAARLTNPDVRIIAASGDMEFADNGCARVEPLHADWVLAKPFEFEDFVSAVTTLLDKE